MVTLNSGFEGLLNIGLRALMDPDWPGAWWSVPCQPKTRAPLPRRVAGCPVFEEVEALPGDAGDATAGKAQEYINLWRDVSAAPITEGVWMTYQDYQRDVEARVLGILRKQHGLDAP